MKTIKDIAKAYYAGHAFTDSDRTFAERHFEEGAEWMQVELTSWHDPKKHLPNDGQEVLCMIHKKYNTYAVLKYYQGEWWQQVHVPAGGWCGYDGEIIGWQDIH